MNRSTITFGLLLTSLIPISLFSLEPIGRDGKNSYLTQGHTSENYKIIHLNTTNVKEHRIMAAGNNSSSITRTYEKPLTNKNKEDITYIVTTLGNESMLSIIVKKKSLDAAGDRTEPVHPLNFLRYVFTNDELKIAIKKIKPRSMLWSNFINGLSRSFNDEKQKNNLKQIYIEDFAKKVGVDLAIINPPIQRGEWKDLVNKLMIHVPSQ